MHPEKLKSLLRLFYEDLWNKAKAEANMGKPLVMYPDSG